MSQTIAIRPNYGDFREMNGALTVFAATAVIGIILIGVDGDRKEAELKLKLQYEQGVNQGLQMQLEKQQVNVTQNNETNGVKVKWATLIIKN